MKRLLRASLATVLAVSASVSSALAAPTCLDTYRIQNTTVPNPNTIIFHMKDGSAWRNTLKNSCPELRFWGFVYVDRGGTLEICDNTTAVKVINSGEICLLGTFSKEPPPAPHT